MAAPQDILLVEVRDSAKKSVSFAALNLQTGHFLWRDQVFDEPWWINLNGAAAGTALFTVYTETNNPDRKGIFGFDVLDQKITWWQNDFSLVRIADNAIVGVASKYGHREVTLDVKNGLEINVPIDLSPLKDNVLRPFQYAEDQQYFSTVKTFLASKFNLTAVVALEYLEHNNLIFISFYTGEQELANYLMILNDEGQVMLKEKLDERLKGIGLDTFFIYAGCVFFVKNKGELFSYKIV